MPSTLGLGLGLPRAYAGGVTAAAKAAYDDYYARVLANGGDLTPAEKAATPITIRDAMLTGVWYTWNRINLFQGTNLAACAVPLKQGAGAALDTLVNFVEADFSSSTGLTGNGSNKYVRTGMLTTALWGPDFSTSHYIRGPSQASNQVWGARLGGGANPAMFAQMVAGGGLSFDCNQGGPDRIAGGITGNGALLTGSRISTTDTRIFQRDTQSALSSTTYTAAVDPALELYVMGSNNSGALEAPFAAACPVAGYHFGIGQTPTMVASAYAIWQAHQTALGRQV